MKILIYIFLIVPFILKAQFSEDLYIYGSLQTIMLNENTDQSFSQNRLLPGGLIGGNIANNTLDTNLNRTSFLTQQMNIFMNKFYEDNLNIFVDLQINQNFNSQKGWGSFSLQEAWVNYTFNEKFQIKAGQLFPSFNNLNEIKNRLNLLNYLFRPIVYESILSEIITSEDFIPETAFLQFHGQVPLDNLNLSLVKNLYFDWALYMGNGEGSQLISNNDDNPNGYLSGSDSEGLEKKLYGFRAGLRSKHENFKIGVSGTRDYNDGSTYMNFLRIDRFDNYPDLLIEDQLRLRIAGDLSFNYKGFFLESEISYSKMEDIKFINQDSIRFNSNECWNLFWYVTLGYDITDDIFVYLGYSDIDIGVLNYTSDSNYGTLGAGWRINEWLSLKGQVILYNQVVKYPFLWETNVGEDQRFIPRLQTMELQNLISIVGFSAHF